MKTIATRTLLALIGTLAWLGSSAAANEELRFSDIEQRLTVLEQQAAAESGALRTAFLSDTIAGEALPLSKASGTSGNAIHCCDTTGCGRETCACGNCGDGNCGCQSNARQGASYAEVQLMWLRAHLLEEAIGKLSEKHELSPRFVVGYESPSGVGGRVRYWTYGRQTPGLGDADDIRFEFDVIDVEATSRFRTRRSDLVIAGGLRWADVEVLLDNDDPVAIDMPGITFAADFRAIACCRRRQQWAAACGARWSILGGDWNGSSDGFIGPTRDDNLVVHEIYGGVEYLYHSGNFDMFARLVFEVQNWHSDAASEDAGADSIGFVGPGIHAGVTF